MRILCLIDSIGPGGAQRQICTLASLLKSSGSAVRLLYYRQSDFFKAYLEKNCIPHELVTGSSKAKRALGVIKCIKSHNPDVIIAFLNIPSIIVEIARMFSCKIPIIVSERSAPHEGTWLKNVLRYNLHRWADVIVTNSYTKYHYLRDKVAWLNGKVEVIPNCVSLDDFRPADDVHIQGLRILILGRFFKVKNPFKFVKAVSLVRKKRPDIDITVDWYGNKYFKDGQPTKYSSVYLATEKAIYDAFLADYFKLHDPVSDVARLYHQSSVLCLPSLYEGMPNVICEAMACGKPILASDVCDNSKLVKHGMNGLLFNPTSPDDMANRIIAFNDLINQEKKRMGKESRRLAENMFSSERFLAQYRDIIKALPNMSNIPRKGD